VRRVTASPRTSITPGSAPGTPKRSLSYTPNRASGPSLSTSDLSSLLTMIGNEEQGSPRDGSPAGGVRLRAGDSGNSSASSSLASSRRRKYNCYRFKLLFSRNTATHLGQNHVCGIDTNCTETVYTSNTRVHGFQWLLQGCLNLLYAKCCARIVFPIIISSLWLCIVSHDSGMCCACASCTVSVHRYTCY
jgi:hypothetical protein